ncbi:RNA-directed DNA polymerase [Tanacetum coccineum]
MFRNVRDVKKCYALVTFEENKITPEHPSIVQPLLNEFADVIREEMPPGLPPRDIRQWDLLLPQIEFAYNHFKNQSIGCSPFEVVYGRNLVSPLELVPLPTNRSFSGDASERAGQIKKLHAQVRDHISKQNERYRKQVNKHMKHVEFREGDMVWIHLRKERFSHGSYSKLKSKGAGPFKVLKKIRKNAYKIDLTTDYEVSNTFNVSDIIPYQGDFEDSRTSLL